MDEDPHTREFVGSRPRPNRSREREGETAGDYIILLIDVLVAYWLVTIRTRFCKISLPAASPLIYPHLHPHILSYILSYILSLVLLLNVFSQRLLRLNSWPAKGPAMFSAHCAHCAHIVHVWISESLDPSLMSLQCPSPLLDWLLLSLFVNCH